MFPLPIEIRTANRKLEPTDINILCQNRLKTPKTSLIPAICFYNGTFTPIHAGHINVLQAAKSYIDNLGTHELLAAYISPSHSGYGRKKLSAEEVIGAGHRLSMINLGIESLDWVMLDLFEIFQPYSTQLSITMKAFAACVRSQLFNGGQMEIFWLKGEDSLSYKNSPDDIIQLGYHNLYVINRSSKLYNTCKDQEQGFDRIEQEKLWKQIRASSAFPER